MLPNEIPKQLDLYDVDENLIVIKVLKLDKTIFDIIVDLMEESKKKKIRGVLLCARCYIY
jgi:hypothetical protein